MSDSAVQSAPTADPAGREMHDAYRRGGAQANMAPHVVYSTVTCPHAACLGRLQAIDFCLEKLGKSTHDPLVTAWWSDVGFAGKCPHCGNWIHFTIREKRAISQQEATELPQLPDNWHQVATIL